MNYTVEYATPEEMFDLAMKAFPFDYDDTGYEDGDFEKISYGEIEYQKEITFKLVEEIPYLEQSIYAGGWVDFRADEDSIDYNISATFSLALSESQPYGHEEWREKSILDDYKTLMGWFDTKIFQWEFSVEVM